MSFFEAFGPLGMLHKKKVEAVNFNLSTIPVGSGYSWQVALQQSLLPLCLTSKCNTVKCRQKRTKWKKEGRRLLFFNIEAAGLPASAPACARQAGDNPRYDAQHTPNPEGVEHDATPHRHVTIVRKTVTKKFR